MYSILNIDLVVFAQNSKEKEKIMMTSFNVKIFVYTINKKKNK